MTSGAAPLMHKEIKLSDDNKANAAFEALLFEHVPEEDITAYASGELANAALIAQKALLAHENGASLIRIDNDACNRSGEPVSIITLVNDNKPFLLDSVMAEISENTPSIYLVSHPVIDVAQNDDQSLSVSRETASGPAPRGKQRKSLMQIHVPLLLPEQSDTLKQGLSDVLEQVAAAVRDWQPMLDTLDDVARHYRAHHPRGRSGDAERVADFLNWLKNDNFTLLGMREYRLDSDKTKKTNKNETNLGEASTELGILTDASIRVLREHAMEEITREALSFMESPDLMIVTKARIRSRVHRRVWLDYIGVKLFNEQGDIAGELRLVGLFTAPAYTSSVLRIPYLKPKAEAVINRLGFNMEDHSGRSLINVLEGYPRDEMFRIDVDTLTNNVEQILELGERPRVRVLADPDPFGHFVSVLVFVPRDRYDSKAREKLGQYLIKVFDGDFFEFYPLFLNNGLTRVHYIIHRKGGSVPEFSQAKIEEDVGGLIRNWEDRVQLAASKKRINMDTVRLAMDLPQSYRNSFSADSALLDAAEIHKLSENNPLEVNFYHHIEEEPQFVSLKLFHLGDALELSLRVPLLENMGFRVIAEQTLELHNGAGETVFLHDMELENAHKTKVDLTKIGKKLAEAFEAIWAEDADDDAFNGLIQSAGLDWREIVIMRAYGRYLQQAGIPYSQDNLARALNNFPNITRDLYSLFRLRFDPTCPHHGSEAKEAEVRDRIELELQDVPTLDDDRILRSFRTLITASLRTNAYKREADGSERKTLAFKLDPHLIDILPDPRPYREIFVYGPAVEGVHLRFGPVARGGLRWSDRRQDYRTEVLGLVKAQQVKNAVIVPVGSKGGFYPHHLPVTNDRAAIGEAARQAYIIYITAMLSITDNIIDGKVVAAKDIIRHDGDDPYFVVAADKGTATFSDTANAISEANDFWLDDAFASGGSAGYDHKAMGITAKGAWEAVKRHFREFDHDIQTQEFSAVGVGDMSGDVFGNGMLLSTKTRLVAAFDHRDIFIDPNPDTDASFAERERLFNLPRTSWQDYDKQKISNGGGVYSRSLKTITLSPEAAKAIGFNKTSGTPFEIINAILQAPVDLLWFGGIGTYIRGSGENDAQVGDHANDAIRITGSQIRAKVVGEGANLGMTQRGRIEYSMKGGRCNTDAIDNSAGVNCSDVEVNIKIALASAMRQGKLSRPDRNILLKSMTDDVSNLVLRNNYLQPLTLSLAEKRAVIDLPYQIRFMHDLERVKLLDRRVEVLPDNEALADRQAKRIGLTRPELSVIMAYAKITLQAEIATNPLSEDPYFETALFNYFPPAMREKYAEEISNHQLRRDIIATLLANDVVNRGGPTFVNRLQDKTGHSAESVIRAFVLVRDSFDLNSLYAEIDALDNKIPGLVQNSFYAAISRMMFAVTSWLLQNVKLDKPLNEHIQSMTEARMAIEPQLETLIPDYMREQMAQVAAEFEAQGAPNALAKRLAMLETASVVPDIALVAYQTDSDLIVAAQTYFKLAEIFRINRIENASRTIPVVDYYDGMALAQANDTIIDALRRMVMKALRDFKDAENPAQSWLEAEGSHIEAIINRMNTLIEGDLNISRFSVAAGMMADLVRKGS